MTAFELPAGTRVIVGLDSIDRLGVLARELHGGDDAPRTLVVTDPGIVAAGHVDRARRILADAGIDAAVFDAVRENPTSDDVDACVDAARTNRTELLIGLGGGSSLDTAKGCNFVLTNGGRIHDYKGHGRATQPMLPLIAVPTTSGTGSECQSYALIADAATHMKMACGDPKAAPRISILDPGLTRSQPRAVTACTGLDAVTHAVEAWVSTRGDEASREHARDAFRLTIDALPQVLDDGDDLDARARMQLGAAHAGAAIELGMLGAAHAAANPLTAHYGITHGHAVAMMLPHVIRYNAGDDAVATAYRDLLATAGRVAGDAGPGLAAFALADAIEALVREAALPLSPAALGATMDAVPTLAAEAAAQWTAGFNPRAVDATAFESLYRAALATEADPT